MRRFFVLAVLVPTLFATAVAAWCRLDAPSRTSDGPAARVAGAAAPATPAVTHQTARVVPITPVMVKYESVAGPLEPLAGARTLHGTYAGGSYQIEVPGNWNGDVVYFAHGFRGNPSALFVTPPALREHIIERGFAWAASSYTRNGYEPGAGARDTYELRATFERLVGAATRSYIYGESMGGHVVTFSLEQYPQAYDGGLSECGVVAGSEILGYFASWAVLAQYLSGVAFLDEARSPQDLEAIINASVTPMLGSPDKPTAAGTAFADVIMRLTGGERPFFREGLAHTFGANFGVLAHAAELAGPASVAAQNVGTTYTIDPALGISADDLNREVSRFVSATAYRDPTAYPEFQPMTGRIERPLLTLHGTGDLFVPISQEQSYRASVVEAGREQWLVQRAVRRPGHCNFTIDERERAFDDLVAWVEENRRPQGEDLSGDLRGAGLAFTVPLGAGDPGSLGAVE